MTSMFSVLALSLLSLLQSNNPVELLFIGDAMQHMAQITAASRGDGTYDYSQCFALIEDEVRAADYAVVNLEVTLGGKPYSGYPCFSAPDSYARQLRDSGFDLFLTANNHCLDTRDRGLARTIATLDSLGVPHLDTYVNATERARLMPHITTIRGIRFAFINYTYDTNGITVQRDAVVDYIDRDLIARDVKAARDAGAQVIVACMHWGIEYTLVPVQEQRDLADFLVDQGVDLIIGGHPHVVEPMEVRHSDRYNKDVLLVYSLGNFISNMNDPDCRGGAWVKVGVAMMGDKPVIINPRYQLFFCQKPTGSTNYMVIPEPMRDKVTPGQRDAFDRFMTRAHSMAMDKNIGVPQQQ